MEEEIDIRKILCLWKICDFDLLVYLKCYFIVFEFLYRVSKFGNSIVRCLLFINVFYVISID